MTRITIFKSGDIYRGFDCSEHAGFAVRGRDVVCAAISMLTTNTINSVEALTSDGFEGDVDEKNALIHFRFKSEPSRESVVLMDSMVLGLEQIIANYGDKYLRLEFKEV